MVGCYGQGAAGQNRYGEAERGRASSVKVDKAPWRAVYNPRSMGGCKRLSGFPLEDYKNRSRDSRHKLSIENSSWMMNKKKSKKPTMRVAKCLSR